MRSVKYFTIKLLLVSSVFSCRQEEINIQWGHEYFGWEEGKYVTYEVTEIFHDINLIPANDTFRYILKTVIGEDIMDNEGRMAKKYFRFSYDINTNELLDQRVWTTLIDGRRGEVVEENQRKIRLVFAPTIDKTWDVNAFNAFPSQRAFYTDLHDARNIDNFFFDSTITVDYDDFLSLVDYRRKFDIYAKDVGLVQRSFKDLRINNFDTLDIRIGTETHYRVIDYGVE